jgi:hypothetical protein
MRLFFFACFCPHTPEIGGFGPVRIGVKTWFGVSINPNFILHRIEAPDFGGMGAINRASRIIFLPFYTAFPDHKMLTLCGQELVGCCLILRF